jgi:hypothetical protein
VTPSSDPSGPSEPARPDGPSDGSAPRTVPAGSELRLGLPSFPPHPPFVERLRGAVVDRPELAAAYVLSIGWQAPDGTTGDPIDTVGLDLVAGAEASEELLSAVGQALAEVAPRDRPLDLVVLSADARTAALGVCAPIGAGGELEMLAARASHDPTAIEQLVPWLLDTRLFVPAVAGGDGEGVPEPRDLEPGEAVRYPITRIDGREAIAVFSSWWSLLYANPPFPDQLRVPCRALLASWPDGIAMAFDVGSQHALLLPAPDVARLRELATGG